MNKNPNHSFMFPEPEQCNTHSKEWSKGRGMSEDLRNLERARVTVVTTTDCNLH